MLKQTLEDLTFASAAAKAETGRDLDDDKEKRSGMLSILSIVIKTH